MITGVLVWAALSSDPAVPHAPSSEVYETSASGEALFRRGVAAYDAHDYARAVEWFRKAYAKDAEPAILFNIAQAERALGDCPKAVESLDAFLRRAGPSDPLVARARVKREELQACAADSDRRRNMAAVAPVTPLTRPTPPAQPPMIRGEPPAPTRERVRSSGTLPATVCSASVGGTIAFGLTDLVLMLAAHSLASKVGAAMTWTDDVQAAEDQRRALGTAATITTVAFGVSAAVAGTSCWLNWRRADREAGVAPP